MNLLPLIIQLVSGAIGGNIAGGALKNLSLGPLGNSIAGIVGALINGLFGVIDRRAFAWRYLGAQPQ